MLSLLTLSQFTKDVHLNQTVQERLAEANEVHRDGHRLGKDEHEADGAAEFWTYIPFYESQLGLT